MGYYVRAFCTSNSMPTIDTLEVALRSDYPEVRITTSEARDSDTWRNAELSYNIGKEPVIVEISVNDGPDSLAAEECQEFREEIGSPGLSRAKKRVLEHLRNTRYIVCCQLLSDIDDDGYNVNGALLNYFVDHHQGVIQADGEGFYDGHKIAVELT